MPLEEPIPGKKPINKIVIIVVVLVLILTGFYFIFNRQKNLPYPRGTKIENFKDFPEGFPKEVVLEKRPLQAANAVKYPDGKQDITVAYISEKPLVELLRQYAEILKRNNWTVKANRIMKGSGAILASKDAGELTITIAPVSDGTMVTFSYKK